MRCFGIYSLRTAAGDEAAAKNVAADYSTFKGADGLILIQSADMKVRKGDGVDGDFCGYGRTGWK